MRPYWDLYLGKPVSVKSAHVLHIDKASVQFLATSVLLLVFSIWLASEKPAWGDGCVTLLPTSTSTGCLPKQLLSTIYEDYILLEIRSEISCFVSWYQQRYERMIQIHLLLPNRIFRLRFDHETMKQNSRARKGNASYNSVCAIGQKTVHVTQTHSKLTLIKQRVIKTKVKRNVCSNDCMFILTQLQLI